MRALEKHFDHITGTLLKDIPAKHKKSAQACLLIAKNQEAEKIKEGYHYVALDAKTKVLRKIN